MQIRCFEKIFKILKKVFKVFEWLLREKYAKSKERTGKNKRKIFWFLTVFRKKIGVVFDILSLKNFFKNLFGEFLVEIRNIFTAKIEKNIEETI